MRRLLAIAISTLFVLPAGSIQAARVDVRPTPVAGISIVSAELVEELGSSAEVLVVRLRNDSAAADQKVALAATIHDTGGAASGGFVRGGCMDGLQIEAPPGGEKVVSRQIEIPLDADDTVAVRLMDVNEYAGGAGGLFPATGYYCQACSLQAQFNCDFGIKSFDCDDDDQHCSYTCLTCEEAGVC